MPYWIVWKRVNEHYPQYISGTDEFGYPEHTLNEENAYHFKDFKLVIPYINMGYKFTLRGV